jgi:large subunit ribosomal protein L28
MPAHCQVSGRGPGLRQHRFAFASANPHAVESQHSDHNVFPLSEGRCIKLRTSANGVKVIDHDGIGVVARIHRNGEKI